MVVSDHHKVSSHFGLINNKTQKRLDIAREKSYRSWKHKFDMPVQNHKEGGITWFFLKKPVYKGMEWEACLDTKYLA